MNKIRLILLIMILLSQGKALFSQEHKMGKPGESYGDSTVIEKNIETIEPILTEETLPNEVGEWDIRFIFDFLKNKQEIYATLPQVQLFFGIFRHLGGEISLPFILRKGEIAGYGLGSVSTSLKWLVLNQRHTVPAIVLGFEVGFSTNSFGKEFEEPAYEYAPYVAFLKDFGRLSLQGNLAFEKEIPVAEGEKNQITELNIALAYPCFDGKVDFLAELNSAWSKNEPNALFVSPGIRYNLNAKHFFALAVPVNLNNSALLRIIFQYQFQF